MSGLDILTYAAAKRYCDAHGGGGTTEFLIVTTTKEQTGYVADKTNAEMYAAHQAGKHVLLHMSYEGQWYLASEVTSTKAKFGFIEDDGQDGVNASVVVMETTGGVMSIDANLWGIVTDTDLTAYRTAAAQNVIDATKQDALTAGGNVQLDATTDTISAKPACVTVVVAVADWNASTKTATASVSGLRVDSDTTQHTACAFTDASIAKTAKPWFSCTTAGTLTIECQGTVPTAAVTVQVVMTEC